MSFNQLGLFGPALTFETRTITTDSIDGLDQLLEGSGLASIAILGVLQEPIFHEHTPGRHKIIDGRGRVNALIAQGAKEISGKIIPFASGASPASIAAATVVANISRRRNPVSEALALREAIVQFAIADERDPDDPSTVDLGLKSFAAAMGINVSILESVYRINAIPAELITASLDGEIAPTVVERLAGKSDVFQAEALKTFQEMGTLTGRIMTSLSSASTRRATERLEAEAPELFESDAEPAPDPDPKSDFGKWVTVNADSALEAAAIDFFRGRGTVRAAREILKSAYELAKSARASNDGGSDHDE